MFLECARGHAVVRVLIKGPKSNKGVALSVSRVPRFSRSVLGRGGHDMPEDFRGSWRVRDDRGASMRSQGVAKGSDQGIRSRMECGSQRGRGDTRVVVSPCGRIADPFRLHGHRMFSVGSSSGGRATNERTRMPSPCGESGFHLLQQGQQYPVLKQREQRVCREVL